MVPVTAFGCYRFWLVSLRAMVRYRWCTIGGKERIQVIANRYQVIGRDSKAWLVAHAPMAKKEPLSFTSYLLAITYFVVLDFP